MKDTKRRLAIPFFILSISMITPNVALAVENKDTEVFIRIPRRWLLAGLIVAIPMYQVMKKTPKTEIPLEEDYSWQEIQKNVEILWNHFVSNNVKKLLRKENKSYSNEQVEEAAKILWKNIKNLYHMGFIGQRRQTSVAKSYKGKYLECSERTPARGILGHFLDMVENAQKASGKMLYLVCAYYFIKHVAGNGLNISLDSEGKAKGLVIKVL